MKLFGHDTSPYVRRVRALLHELGAECDRDTAGWMEPSAAMLEANPIAKVPALEVNENGQDLVLVDSKTIADWLLARHGVKVSAPASPPFQATLFHPAHRYEDENVLTIADAALDSAIQIFLFERDKITPETAPYLKRQNERVGKCLAWLDARYADRVTLHDDVLSFIDLGLYCALDWFEFRKRLDFSSYRNLVAFKSAQKQRASLAATDPRAAEDKMTAKK
ncbi:MAG: glutathione S-transferase family protein [Polyangiaceae bacterium]